MAAVIEVQNLHKTYGDTLAVYAVAFGLAAARWLRWE